MCFCRQTKEASVKHGSGEAAGSQQMGFLSPTYRKGVDLSGSTPHFCPNWVHRDRSGVLFSCEDDFSSWEPFFTPF